MDTTDWEDENNIYLVIAISDGDSMSDKHYGAAELKEIIEGCQATGRWTFTHMGCNENYLEEMAKETGIPMANYAAWDNTSLNSTRGGMRRATARTQKYCASIASGQTGYTANFMSDVDNKVADFTAPLDVADAPRITTTNETTGVFSNTKAVDWPVEEVKVAD
jgi:hypothetical protein